MIAHETAMSACTVRLSMTEPRYKRSERPVHQTKFWREVQLRRISDRDHGSDGPGPWAIPPILTRGALQVSGLARNRDWRKDSCGCRPGI